MNLNINVNALRPGVGPKKPPTLSKSQSLFLPDDQADSFLHELDKKIGSPTDTPSPVALNKDSTDNGIEVLPSVTKDRVKIPVKRRPSTRKGRQEAIRKSALDLPFYYEDNAENNIEDPPFLSSTDKNEIICPKDPTTNIDATTTEIKKDPHFDIVIPSQFYRKPIRLFDDDIFSDFKFNRKPISSSFENLLETDKVPYRMLKPEPNKTEENKATVETKIVPDEDKPTSMTVENSTKVVLETEDLLQVQPAYGADISEDLQKIEVSKSTITKKTSLFDDNDSDDNELFSNKTSLKKKQDVHIPRFATDNKKTETKKSRLFGSDDDSDGDLFQKSSTKRNSDKMPPSLKTERVKSKDLYKSSLFNDSSSDDDLFSSGAKGRSEKSIFNKAQETKKTDSSKLF